MKKIRPVICLALAASVLFCASCGLNGKKFSEGVDTVCEVTGYSEYSGPYQSLFLQEGDRIAVISPSSLPSQKQVDAVVNGLKKWGYVPVKGKFVTTVDRTLADCMEDLTWALEDPQIRAVFCVRGGYAGSEVMDLLPEEKIAAAGKMIIGYSDITIYHCGWTAAGLPSVHAAMSAAFMDLEEACVEAERKLLQGEIPAYRCAGNAYCRQGAAEGLLIGGNLSTFAAAIGTAYDSSKLGEPYILFLEDVEEDMEHIHRLLTILKHLGILDGAEAVIFGEWVDVPAETETYNGESRGGKFASVAEMIHREFLPGLDIPVAFGFPAGHGDVNYPLLMGEKVRLDVAEDAFTLEWIQ